MSHLSAAVFTFLQRTGRRSTFNSITLSIKIIRELHLHVTVFDVHCRIPVSLNVYIHNHKRKTESQRWKAN